MTGMSTPENHSSVLHVRTQTSALPAWPEVTFSKYENQETSAVFTALAHKEQNVRTAQKSRAREGLGQMHTTEQCTLGKLSDSSPHDGDEAPAKY